MKHADLPAPPSSNHLYFNAAAGGRRKTKVYKDWISSAGMLLNRARLDAIADATPCRVVVLANVDRRRDIDNVIKPAIDLLTRVHVFRDDRWVDQVLCARNEGIQKGWIRITVAQLP